jgi:hypothetical protein
MRCVVEYDVRGLIKTIGAAPSEESGSSPRMQLRPRAGHRVTTIDAREISDASDHHAIVNLKRSFLVEEHQGKHRFVKR